MIKAGSPAAGEQLQRGAQENAKSFSVFYSSGKLYTSRRLRNVVCALTAASAFVAPFPRAAAQSSIYPSRAIRFIVPLPAGGGADIVARIVAERLTKSLGQQVLVDNRSGGGTVIGADLAAKAPPDGYTLLLGTATTHAINASLVKKLPYDPIKDFAPITLGSRAAADHRFPSVAARHIA